MTIILFIGVLLVTVLVHEWGHYITAKKSGMLVEEFGFGIPPRLWSWKKGETNYSINALLIGGFVKIAGENGEDLNIPKDRQFESKPWYTKSLVLLAGVIMNIVLALVLFTVAYMIGLPGMVAQGGTPTVLSVVDGSPVAKTSISVGDTVKSISVGGTVVSNLSTNTLHDAIVSSSKDVAITYIHEGTERTDVIVPTEERTIGISVESIGTVSKSFGGAIKSAWHQVVSLTHNILTALGMLVSRIVGGHPSVEGLIGPVGLAKEVGNAATFGFAYLLAFIATISINLAVLNAMPFPALDGGRLIVVWVEAIVGKKLSPLTAGIVHGAGFLILIGLMITLTIGDIKRAL